MTNNNIYSNLNTISNSLKVNNKIKLSMHKGTLAGNIIPIYVQEIEVPICSDGSLDFSCSDNSEYIPII